MNIFFNSSPSLTHLDNQNSPLCYDILFFLTFIQIKVPDAYQGHLCGLCGNWDGDRTNDLTIGGKKMTPEEYGMYYFVPGSEAEE